MRIRELGLRILVAVALVAVAVKVIGADGSREPIGKVLVCRGVSMHGVYVLEVVTDSASVYASGQILVPSGASAFIVYRDGCRFLVADGITYGSIFGVSSLPIGRISSPPKRRLT